jgi:ribosomal protein L37AE/L43A
MPRLMTTMMCPACGHKTVETMPTSRFVFVWECPSCKAQFKPKDGDCCVYVSYGDRLCPFLQNERPWLES